MTTAAELLLRFRDFLEGLAGAVPERFLAGIGDALVERELAARPLVCLRHLQRAGELAPPAAKPLLDILIHGGDQLHWGQTYTAADFGQKFVDNYGWLELLGTRGHFVHDEIAAGLLILGPQLLYPDHHHVAEEIYIPLTGGTEWRKSGGDFVVREAGEVIHHPSNVNHAMRTGDDPLLALYLWRGGPLAQRPVIGGGR
ncbi:dimethylsulfonioproprionate lyase family protein [Mesorhizobium sp. LHD-90]|uniref:dimethylsulfonioproprionate lyase family protein n=1 Tax=Mesorhizobium sp. LHD-90 TaxID=3071414 RepID=UPI0027E0CFE3|nr:dimethylsulfonioproprionate lyase family protein [Mesorhizobium sp. LHD-90]MDQ6433057.1 dimethylsulfonioproprionate lyase family protein [Mesorhizobium sp. LHD-90]